MSMIKWAESELNRLLTGNAEDDEMQKEINKDILHIVEVFSEQGHSGFSAGYALNIIKKLLAWKPITALTGEDDEWSPVKTWDKGDNSQQNNRCSAVFRKNFDNSTAYYIEGKVFSDNGGHTWFQKGCGGGCNGSAIPVTFPFKVPEKPEYIYLNGEDSDEIITDEKRIKELYDEWTEKYKEVE